MLFYFIYFFFLIFFVQNIVRINSNYNIPAVLKLLYQFCDRQQMLEFGPLVALWTFRLESKHNEFKEILSSCRCSKNVCFTMANQHQYNQSLLHSTSNIVKRGIVKVVHAKQVQKIPNQIKNVLDAEIANDKKITLAKKVVISNTTYEKNLAVPTLNDDGSVKFMEFSQALTIDDEVYLVLQELATLRFDRHFNAYIVQRLPQLRCIRADQINARNCPLGIYSLNNNERAVALRHKIKS